MDLFSRIIQRLRPSAPEPNSPAEPPAPPTLTELHELHDSVISDRAAAEATILEAPAKRDALLDQPGTDRVIRKLDADVDAAHLLLERLERVRPELELRISAANAATRADGWAEMRSRLVKQITSTQYLMRLAETSYLQTCEMRLEGQRAGFTTETQALPYHCDAHRVNSAVMATMATSIRAQQLVEPRTPPTWTVRFLAWTAMHTGTAFWTGYQQGQCAGFDAATAWALVEAGKAEWADPKVRAPKPRKRKKGEKPPAAPPELVASFGDGPIDPAEELQNAGKRSERTPDQATPATPADIGAIA